MLLANSSICLRAGSVKDDVGTAPAEGSGSTAEDASGLAKLL